MAWVWFGWSTFQDRQQGVVFSFKFHYRTYLSMLLRCGSALHDVLVAALWTSIIHFGILAQDYTPQKSCAVWIAVSILSLIAVDVRSWNLIYTAQWTTGDLSRRLRHDQTLTLLAPSSKVVVQRLDYHCCHECASAKCPSSHGTCTTEGCYWKSYCNKKLLPMMCYYCLINWP